MTHVATTQRLAPDRVLTPVIGVLSGHTGAMAFFQLSGEVLLWSVLAVCCTIEVRRAGSWAAAVALSPIAFGWVLTECMMKPLVDRRIIIPNEYVGPPTFPSGHSTVLWTATFLVLLRNQTFREGRMLGRTRYVVVGPAIVASVFFVLSFSHFLTDVVGGLLTAAVIASAFELARGILRGVRDNQRFRHNQRC
jgi:membrane-associated phospholipid phosphatase